jgi:hypothetical protein
MGGIYFCFILVLLLTTVLRMRKKHLTFSKQINIKYGTEGNNQTLQIRKKNISVLNVNRLINNHIKLSETRRAHLIRFCSVTEIKHGNLYIFRVHY